MHNTLADVHVIFLCIYVQWITNDEEDHSVERIRGSETIKRIKNRECLRMELLDCIQGTLNVGSSKTWR